MLDQELRRIEAVIDTAVAERERLIAREIATSRCANCPHLSRAKAGIIPTCQNVRSGNYSRRFNKIESCPRWSAP